MIDHSYHNDVTLQITWLLIGGGAEGIHLRARVKEVVSLS